MARVLIAGCGYVGTALGRELAARGDEVFGLRRRPEGLPPGIHGLAADLGEPRSLEALPRGIEAVAYLASAAGFADEAYRAAYVDGLQNLLDALLRRGEAPRRIVLASSTAVYGQQAGEWVDEGSPTEPVGFSGRRLLEAEALVARGAIPASVLRLGGIYGPGRTRLIESVRGGNAVCREGLYTNRIHRDDAAGAIAHLLGLAAPEALYVGVDQEPVEECRLLGWIAERIGAPRPRREGPGALATRAGGRPHGSKRCRSARLRHSGYRLRYPSYREGYGALLRELGLLRGEDA
jgi:nucleoside-diphosphate-sugar epimerase